MAILQPLALHLGLDCDLPSVASSLGARCRPSCSSGSNTWRSSFQGNELICSSYSPLSYFWGPSSQGNELMSTNQRYYRMIAKLSSQRPSDSSRSLDCCVISSSSSSSSTSDLVAEEKDEDDGNFADFHVPNFNKRLGDWDVDARYRDGTRRNSAMARILERLGKIPAADRGWKTSDNPILTLAAPSSETFRPDTRFPWEREDTRSEVQAARKLTRASLPSLAESTLPEDELKRLRTLSKSNRHRIKVGRAGVTGGILESIHNRWRKSEVANIECKGPPAHNMKLTHEILEEKTGGLVVWREGGTCSVYRGKDYVPPLLKGLLGFCEQPTLSSVAKSQEIEAENEGGQ